mmetsp:Transcript_63061/g.170192  ORF Transcript_63061/g.170192 Transcript_63061/m.170192 type:complete len:233 (-) Transcript_63061:86-784(-)
MGPRRRGVRQGRSKADRILPRRAVHREGARVTAVVPHRQGRPSARGRDPAGERQRRRGRLLLVLCQLLGRHVLVLRGVLIHSEGTLQLVLPVLLPLFFKLSLVLPRLPLLGPRLLHVRHALLLDLLLLGFPAAFVLVLPVPLLPVLLFLQLAGALLLRGRRRGLLPRGGAPAGRRGRVRLAPLAPVRLLLLLLLGGDPSLGLLLPLRPGRSLRLHGQSARLLLLQLVRRIAP